MHPIIPPELLHPELFIPAATMLGLLLGSFYNVCIHRYLTGESILFPPSHCPHCKQRLRFWELVPVLSYLLLGGKCARCRNPIHIRYPLVELLSGLTAGLLAWRYVKLMLMLGALCGPMALPLVTLVAGIAALVAFVIIACIAPREAPLRETPIPFGPFLSLGAFVHILAGSEILDWWIQFIAG